MKNKAVIAFVMMIVGLAACGSDDNTDAPAPPVTKSRSQIVADACHEAYAVLQHNGPHGVDNYNGVAYTTDYAYLVAFTTDYCEGGR